MCWTVGISPLGVGPTGRGNLFPLPCLPHSNHLTLLPASPTLPAPSPAGDSHTLLRHPHPTRAFGAPPPPPEGAWAVRGDIRRVAVHGVEPVGYRARFLSGISPCAGPWGYRHWGWGRRGGGTRSPSPVSHTPTILPFCRPPPSRPRLRQRIPIPFCRHPHPTRACGAPPPPPSGAWAVRGDIRGAAVSGVEPVGYRARFLSGISPCAGPWGYRHWG